MKCEEEFEYISPKIDENIVELTLPLKSRERYEIVYSKFMEWRSTENLESFSETVFLAYFEELSQKYKSSSLWAIFSMLRTVINVKHNTDIAKYLKLRAFLKIKLENHVPKKSKILTPEDFNKFLNTAPDETYLLMKAVIVVGLAGGCKREELCQLTVDDMEDLNSVMLIKLKNSKNMMPRLFTITGNFYDICKKYASLRPKHVSEKRFFLNYKNGKCTKQVVGINKIGRMAKGVATFLKLPNPEQYTGHCFRLSSATMLVNAGRPLSTLKYHGQCSSSTVADEYINDIKQEIQTFNEIDEPWTPTDESSQIIKQEEEILPDISESCFHQSSTMLINAGGDVSTLNHHGEWSSSTVTEEYIDGSIKQEIQTFNEINEPVTSTDKSSKIIKEEEEIFPDISTTCFHQSAPTMSVNVGEDVSTLNHHGEWSSSIVAEEYVDGSIKQEIQTFNKIDEPVTPTSESSNKTTQEVKVSCATDISITKNLLKKDAPVIYFKNCSNITINYYFK